MRDIVVGVDRSTTARAAAERAAELAAALEVNLHVVTAVQDAELTNIEVGIGKIDWSWKGADDIAALIDALPYDHVTHAAVSNDPATALCEEAERVGAQAIVVGNKRVQGVSRALGSVAGAVLRRAPCDVFVVSTAGQSAMSDAMWDAVAARGRRVAFAPGDTLLHQGEVSRHCYALLAGEVLVTAVSAQGTTVVLGRRARGAVIGELGALDGSPRSATVRAVTEVQAVALSADEFESLLRDEPDLALAELKRLSRQFRALSDRYSVRGEELQMRVVQLLDTHASETGDPVFRSTRAELAGWVGATREAVTRTLKDLEDAGRVTLGRGSVRLLDAS